jgi:hypothetical protein
MILEILFAVGIVLLGIIYYVSMYGAKKKSLKDWKTDRGMLFSLLAQNMLLLVAIFVSMLYRRAFFLDAVLLAVQVVLFILTTLQAYRSGRMWSLPIAILIVLLHFIVFI